MRMTIDWVRRHCLALPHVTEDVKWETNLTFCVAEKMFALCGLETGETWLSFKCSPEDFAELTERPGCRPAPYLARAQWVALEEDHSLSPGEVSDLLRRSYELIFAKLPKKVRVELGG